MESRVLHAKDYRTVALTGRIIPFVLDEAALEQELRRLTNLYIRWEPGDRAAAGDLVTCRLLSDCPRFNKENIRFAAGSDIFHPKLERLSLGVSVGETREIDLPEGRVSLTVLEVKRRVVPGPTDEMAAALKLEGVSDLASYRDHLIGQQKRNYLEKALYEPTRYLIENVLAGTEFVLQKEDWRSVVDRRLEHSRVLCRQEGLVLEEMTPEQFEGRMPVRSYHELVALEQDNAWNTLRMYLLGKYYAQTDGFTVGETAYAAYIADNAAFWRIPPEQAREADPYDSFIFGEYVNHAYNVLRVYVEQLF